MRVYDNKSNMIPNKKGSSLRIYTFTFVLIIFIALFLRFYNLTERGLLYYDEGYYANQAKFVVLSLKWIMENINEVLINGINLDSLWNFVNDNGGTFPDTRKPAHDLLNVVSFLIFGIHDWSIFIMSALFGVGTVIMVFLIGEDFYNFQSGLIASSILAVSNLHVWFSRSAMAQANSVFFVILGVYLYFKSFQGNNRSTRKLLLAGLCIGFAFTIHPNLFLVPIIFFISEAFFLIRRGLNNKLVQDFFKATYLGFFMLLPLFIFQIPYFIFKSFYGEKLASMSSKGVFLSYFDQVFGVSNIIIGRVSDRFSFSINSLGVLYEYLQDLWVSEGIVVLIFLILGSGYLSMTLLKNRDHKTLLLLLLFFFPLLFWGISGTSFRLRLIYIILPILSIIAGIGAKSLFDNVQKKFSEFNRLSDVLVLTFILFVLVIGSYNTKETINLKVKPTYRALEQSLIDHIDKNDGILTDKQGHFYPIMRFYLGNIVDKFPARFRENIILNSEITKKKKVPYYGDYIIMLGDKWKDPPHEEIMKEKTRGCMPVISLKYPVTFVKSDKPVFDPQKFQLLKVFDLRKCDYESKKGIL